MKVNSIKHKTAKSVRRPRIENGEVKNEKLKGYVKQLITLLALQQAVARNLQKELYDGKE